jgi:hypothetical protein
MLCNKCPFVKKLLLFALSLLSFVDNQHLGMKKDFRRQGYFKNNFNDKPISLVSTYTHREGAGQSRGGHGRH